MANQKNFVEQYFQKNNYRKVYMKEESYAEIKKEVFKKANRRKFDETGLWEVLLAKSLEEK